MRAVVTPGKSEPRAAVANDSASRTKSWVGLPITAWSRSRICMSIRPLLSPVGPRLPAWQSPTRLAVQPLIKLDGAAAHISVGGARHLQVSQLDEVGHAGGGTRGFHEGTR